MSGYIKNLWSGDRSLFFTYWVVYALGNTLLGSLEAVVDLAGFYVQPMDGGVLFLGLLLQVTLIVFYIFSAVAVWRSAGKYEGSRLWPIAAKVTVVVATLMTIRSLIPV